MKFKTTKIFNRFYISFLIVCFLLSVYLVAEVMGRYSNNYDDDTEVRAAAFAFDAIDASDDFILDISEVDHPGAKKEYTFKVTNSKEKISEVSLLVSASISLEGELPLSITLTDGMIDFIKITSASEKNADIITFAAGENGSKELTLIVEWPAEKNDASYSGKTSKITISMTAEQID